MNSLAPTADTLPLAPPLTLVTRPVRAKRSVLIAGAAFGLLSAILFDGGAFGLGFTIATSAFATMLLAGSGREGRQTAKGQRWLVMAAVVLSGFVSVRDSELLVALDVLAVVVLMLLAVRGWNGANPTRDLTLPGLSAAPFKVLSSGVRTGAEALAEEARGSRFAETWPKLLGPIAKMGLVGVPLIGVVTLLLASGDAAFGQQVELVASGLLELPMTALTRAVMVAVWMGVSSIGLVTWALRRRSQSDQATSAQPSTPLGLPEALAGLVGLTVVLMLFSLVSARCAFAPNTCSLPEGMSYSSYARQGFWQLLAVAGIVLFTVLVLPARTKTEGRGEFALKAASTALVMATLPMLLSAVNRMMLYEDTYGFTRQRLFSQVICVFVALLLIWRAVTVWSWPRRFAVGVVGASVLVLTAFNVMNPDAFIARMNVEREGTIDAEYLAGLSADAASVLREIPESRLSTYHAAIFAQQHSAPERFSSFNLARACDRVVDPLTSSWCP